MVRALLLILSILISFLSTAQGSLHSMGLHWKVAVESPGPDPFRSDFYTHFQVSKDTLIDNKRYNIVAFDTAGITLWDSLSGSIPFSGQYYARLDSNGTLYVRFDSIQMSGFGSVFDRDIPTLDYSLNVGDTAGFTYHTGSTHLMVTKVDSVFIGGIPRRRIEINQGEDIWIEGLGGRRTLLLPWLFEFEHQSAIYCIKDSLGQVVYEPWVAVLGPKYNCSYVLTEEEGIEMIEPWVTWEGENVTIHGVLGDHYEAVLFDISGRILQSWNLENQQGNHEVRLQLKGIPNTQLLFLQLDDLPTLRLTR